MKLKYLGFRWFSFLMSPAVFSSEYFRSSLADFGSPIYFLPFLGFLDLIVEFVKDICIGVANVIFAGICELSFAP